MGIRRVIPMVELTFEFDDKGLANAFKKKATETTREFNKLTKDLTLIAQRWVQKEAPRKTGNLKASVKQKTTGTSGLVWVSKSQANYVDYVIRGRKGFKAKKGKALRFVIAGKVVFVKSVGPAKANPFVDRAATNMKSELNQRIKMFEKWLGDI